MKFSKRIIPFIFTFATVLSFFAVPVRANEYESKPNFWSWAFQNSAFLQNSIGNFYGDFDHACSQSSDGRHHASGYEKDLGNGYYSCICSECGERFSAYMSDAYQEHVQSMPVNGIDSEGGFLWYPTCADAYTNGPFYLYLKSDSYYSTKVFGSGDGWLLPFKTSKLNVEADGNTFEFLYTDTTGFCGQGSGVHFSFVVPVSGVYTQVMNTPCIDYSAVYKSGSIANGISYYTNNYEGTKHFNIGSILYVTREQYKGSDTDTVRVSGVINLPVFNVIPDSAPTGLTVESRPTAIYAPIAYTDNSGQVKTTETTIVNETDKSVYNPVTGDTTTYSDWKYDYSTRTYTFSDESGNTSTVRYGDDNIEVVEGGNTYIYNYYMSDGGNGSGGDTPAPGHKHTYTSEITREATCTTAGVETFTCSECGESYTKAIPALGHDWVVKEQIPTSYDENGEIVTQGYTIYRCTRCGEEYKSTDGKPPESGGKGGSSLWDKIGELIGTVGGGLFGLIGQFLSSVLDVLISLAKEIGDKLAQIVEMILGWFDEVPKLFEGFLGFLAAVFPFLPAEAMLLLTFGIAAVVFIGIIKALRRH